MGESAEQVTSFVLNHMRIADMRPREDFERGDPVQVIGTSITGRIERIDADRRLAWLITDRKDGWWYLKDLEKISFFSRRVAENAEKTLFSRKGAEDAMKFLDDGNWIIIDDPLFSERARSNAPLQVPC